ncbi:flagellar brake protein [Azonexus sp. IMCC34839]|uniref:flagellar brake protein n=1 Tax=Azonexus sp. IMCC34839 TaxID=3133695 RepID=UPI00399A1A5B
MTQNYQMTDAEIDERFRVSGAKPVAFLLAGYAKTREAFSVHFNHGEDMFLTTLLEVQADKGRLVFDCSGSAESNRRIVLSDKVTFGGHPGGVPVHFSTGKAAETTFEGGKAFAVALPEFIIRLQRREHFRIETPRVNPLVLFARAPNGVLLKLQVHDISVGGIGVDAPELPEGVDLGVTMPNCHFTLPGDPKDLFFSATVRNYHEYESRTGQRMVRIGLQFNDLSNGDENRIQRYIAKVERERHELI